MIFLENPYDEIQNIPGVICGFWHHVTLEFLMFGVKPTKKSPICLLNWYFTSHMASCLVIFEKFNIALPSGLCLNVSIYE